MLDRFKAFWQGKALAPFVNLFIRLGISPDVVTLVGTVGLSVGALWFFPQGELWQGVLFIAAFVFSDLIDGAMARKTGRTDASARSWTRPSTGSPTGPSSPAPRCTSRGSPTTASTPRCAWSSW